MHVFADLEPYLCTFPNCRFELVQFATRAAWADHEFSCHRFETRWRCLECGSEEKSSQDWDRHIQGHRLALTGPELLVSRKKAQISRARPIETEECLLCRDTPAQSRPAFIEHVGCHLEEMALISLPGETEAVSEGLYDRSSQNSRAVGHGNIFFRFDSDMKQLEATRLRQSTAFESRSATRERRSYPHYSASLLSNYPLAEISFGMHSNPFVCIFQRYGCYADMRSQNEWKHHITVKHLDIETWRCDLDSCASPIPAHDTQHKLDTASSAVSPSTEKKADPGNELYQDFDSKDLFTQHIKRMHAPPPSASHADRIAFEAQIPAIQERCYIYLQSPPPRSRCPYCLKNIFEGAGSWSDRLEHIGEHLERKDRTREVEMEDEELKAWTDQQLYIRWQQGQNKLWW